VPREDRPPKPRPTPACAEGRHDAPSGNGEEPAALIGPGPISGLAPIAVCLVILLSGCGAGRGDANIGPNPGGGFNIGAEHGDNGSINPAAK
jgi:hypothetical protein